jgi:hypothetical protein
MKAYLLAVLLLPSLAHAGAVSKDYERIREPQKRTEFFAAYHSKNCQNDQVVFEARFDLADMILAEAALAKKVLDFREFLRAAIDAEAAKNDDAYRIIASAPSYGSSANDQIMSLVQFSACQRFGKHYSEQGSFLNAILRNMANAKR